jgi:ubiquinone/menaquinone biosynthesis C-methylase UbiE
MSSVSFDRAVAYYDETRGFAPGVAEQIRDAIVQYTQIQLATSRLLEVGVGTGRIALPFIEAGYDYTGVDISLAMMEQFQQKIAKLEAVNHTSNYRYQLIQADVSKKLPFAANTFDLALSVLVLHLVGNWQAAVTEIKRVLKKPGGWLLIAGASSARPTKPLEETNPTELDPNLFVYNKWSSIIRDELGVEPHSLRTGLGGIGEDGIALEAYLKNELGATTLQRVSLGEYEQPAISLAIRVKRHQARMYSMDWQLSDEVHAEASRRIQRWLDQEIGSEQANKLIVAKDDFKVLAVNWSE